MKRIFKLVLINVIIFVVGIVSLEILFGGWFDARKLNKLNLTTDKTYSLNVSELYPSTSPETIYTRDKYGLRGTHNSPREIDILTVGGSTTDQKFIGDGATWQDVIQQQFTDSGMNLIIANAGIDGQSTYGHLKNFEWWFPYIPNLSPKFILYYVGLNDFNRTEGRRQDRLVKRKHKFNLIQNIENYSAIWNVLRKIEGTYDAMIVKEINHRNIDFDEKEWTTERLHDNYDFMQPRLEDFAVRLKELSKRTIDLGAVPVFISQPARKYRMTPTGMEGIVSGNLSRNTYEGIKITGVDFFHMMRKMDQTIKQVALETDAVYIDLGSQTDWDDEDFYDFFHMTPSGAKKVGLFIYTELKNIVQKKVQF
jgi:hypothetical protein